ncbi:MAG: hypothetical protein C0502_07845 [Opitutus sp.]|nr:hypothetical protein [Opitutus sp.]
MHARFPRIAGWLAALAVPALAPAQTEGTAQWSFLTSGPIYGAPAIASDGTLYVGNEASVANQSRLYAIRPDGSLRWQFTGATDWIDSAPAIGPDGTVYAASWDGKLYAIDPATGAKRWQYAAVGFIASSPAIAADGTIYIGSGDRNLHAVNPDGTGKWTYPVEDWIDSAPAIGPDGTVYFGCYDGNVYALRPDGTLRWQASTGDNVISSPALGADGTVYLGSNDGKFYAFDGSTGALRWSFTTAGSIMGSAAVGADGTVYFGSADGYFYALHGTTGALVWRFNVGAEIYSTPALRADGVIVFGSGDSYLYALNADGSARWRLLTGDFVDSSPALAPDGTIYVGSFDRRLYAVYGNGQGPAAAAPWGAFHRDAQRDGRSSPPSVPLVVANTATLGQPLRLSIAVANAGTFSYQWRRDDIPLAGATAAELTIASFQPADTGFYSATVSDGVTTRASNAVLVAHDLAGSRSAGNVTVVGTDIRHPNGNIYDQFLLTGAGGTISARSDKITRVSYVDLTDDIVQVEFTGTGAVTIVLDSATGPQPPALYNQSAVSYMKGHARIYFADTASNSHLSVFSVGTYTAVNQSLFLPGVAYDGVADIARIGIASPTRAFSGLRAGNAGFYATGGLTGLQAPDVEFAGPIIIHDVTAALAARPVLVTGPIATGELWLTGGNLAQTNSAPVEIGQLERIVMRAGTDSHGRLLPAQTSLARIERNGTDVTNSIVVNPPATP